MSDVFFRGRFVHGSPIADGFVDLEKPIARRREVSILRDFALDLGEGSPHPKSARLRPPVHLDRVRVVRAMTRMVARRAGAIRFASRAEVLGERSSAHIAGSRQRVE